MQITRPDSNSPSTTSRRLATPGRRLGIASFAGLTVLLCSGSTAPTQCQGHIGPTTGEVVGVGVAAGAVIAVAIIVPVEISRAITS
jgi:hypothetical protein